MKRQSVLLPTQPVVSRKGSQQLPDSSLQVVFHGPLPPQQTFPGLDPLASTSRLFTVLHRNAQLPTIIGEAPLPLMSRVFSIYNGKGELILRAGEAKTTPFFRFPPFQTLIYVCSVKGQLLLTLVQRSEGCFVGFRRRKNNKEPQLLLSPCYKADSLIRSIKSADVGWSEEIGSHPHLIHQPSGQFLGHYFQGYSSVTLLDANFRSILTFKKRESLIAYLDGEKDYLDEDDEEEEEEEDEPLPEPRSRSSRAVRDSFVSAPDGRHSQIQMLEDRDGRVKYDLMEDALPVGRADSHTTLKKLLKGDVSTLDCFTCSYPREFSQVDKALVLGFVLYKQRQTVWGEQALHLVVLVFLVLVVIFSFASCTFAILWRFGIGFQ